LLGGMQIRGLETTGSTLVLSALAWLGSNVCVGVAEEFFSRSYLLQTLKRSIGFRPGALVIASRRAARYGGELPDVPSDCVDLGLHLVALPATRRAMS
jgi:hypothetical protein